MSEHPKTKKSTLPKGRRELAEIVETCEAISNRKFNPFFLDVKLGVDTLREYFPFWERFTDLCLDAHTLNRLSEVVRLQNTQLKFQSSKLYADPEFIARKVERMSEKRLAEVILQSWHPLSELEQLTEEILTNAIDYWNALPPIAERWKRRDYEEATKPSAVNNQTLMGLGIHGEEFDKQLANLLNELREACKSTEGVEYWSFVRRPEFQDTVHRAYLVSFLVTYDYAKMNTSEGKVLLHPTEHPTGKTKPNSVSFPIPIQRSP